MFENEHEFKQLISRLKIDSTSRHGHKQELREQMLWLFEQTRKRETELSDKNINDNFSILKIWSLRIAAVAAVVILTAVIGSHIFNNRMQEELPEFLISTVQQPWMHAVVTNYHDGNEQVQEFWFNFTACKKFQIDSLDEISEWDYSDQKRQYDFRGQAKTLTISSIPNSRLFEGNLALNLLCQFVECEDSEDFIPTGRNNNVRIFKLDRSFNTGDKIVYGNRVFATQLRIEVDTQSGLIVAGAIDYLNENEQLVNQSIFKVDYPDSGPADIYELGVPDVVEIIDLSTRAVIRPTPEPIPTGTPENPN
jgi:hypothetical protein